MKTLVAATILLALGLGGMAFAHGVHTAVTAGPTTTITCEHEDGAPMAGAAWTATGPDGAVSGAGVTDVQGRAVFRPDRPGAWRVRVASPDGHGAVVNVEITAAQLAGEPVVAAEQEYDHDHDHGHDYDHDTPRPAFRLSRSAAGFAALCVGLGLVYFVLRWRKA